MRNTLWYPIESDDWLVVDDVVPNNDYRIQRQICVFYACSYT